MNCKPIITAIALSLATTAALAQSGPDFSPMKPGGLEQQNAQPPVTTQNRMLESYEASAPPPAVESSATTVYEQPVTVYEAPPAVYPAPGAIHESPRARVESQPPRQSTIGNGLFDRRGPNDFGA